MDGGLPPFGDWDPVEGSNQNIRGNASGEPGVKHENAVAVGAVKNGRVAVLHPQKNGRSCRPHAGINSLIHECVSPFWSPGVSGAALIIGYGGYPRQEVWRIFLGRAAINCSPINSVYAGGIA